MKLRATLIGSSAILMWSLLALLTAASGTIPPFQLCALCFAIGAIPGMIALIVRPERFSLLVQPVRVWVVGISGLFGYHFLYFTALRNAPAVEANLIADLWPLFIVLGSALLPGEKLGLHHIGGGLAGLAGTGLIVAGKGFEFSSVYALGYGAALLCAFTWSSYSLVTRRFAAVSTDVVTGFCLVSALLSALSHWMLETTVWPDTATQWLAIVGLGLLPMGAAFYAWDHGVKNGDIQFLGVASYGVPVLSTLILIIGGFAEPSLQILLACGLVTGGALLAASQGIGGSPKIERLKR